MGKLNKQFVEYKGIKYPLLFVAVQHKEYFKDGAKLILGTESLNEALSPYYDSIEETGEKKIACEIDEKIYYYLPDKDVENCNTEADLKKLIEEGGLDEDGFILLDYDWDKDD
jgi:hypothetical protein